jgi:hypothetical protein
MAAWFPRRLSPRVVLVPLLSLAVLATISFVNWTERSSQWKSATTSVPCQAADKLTSRQIDAAQTTGVDWWTPLYAQAHTRILHEPSAKIPSERCPSVRPSRAAIDTTETYSTLNFQVTFSGIYFSSHSARRPSVRLFRFPSRSAHTPKAEENTPAVSGRRSPAPTPS